MKDVSARCRVWFLWFLAFCASLTGILQAQQPVNLSLAEAVARALSEEGNAAIRLAREEVEQARAASRQARSALLPHLDATVAEQNQTRNLEALGLKPQGLFRPPTLVGPFTTFDARANLNQSVFDLSAVRRFQASKSSLQGARVGSRRSADLVAGRIAGFYLKALQARASLQAAQADVELANELLGLAVDLRAAGSGTRVEETRAGVQLAAEQQRLLALQFESRRAVLELLRHIGMDLQTPIALTGTLTRPGPLELDFPQAVRRAFVSRSDWKAQSQAVETAQKLSGAARFERLPKLSAFANYGSIGASPADSIPTWAAGLWVRIPVFLGGRLEAEKRLVQSQQRAEEIRASDLQRQIELEVRLALSGVELAQQQIEVADQGLELAGEELAQARRRYQAGFTSSLEVTGAQTRLERARENQISALYELNLARVRLSEAMGTIQDDLE